MQSHVLEEWRIRDVEQKAERASSRLYELDALRGDVDSLERSDREVRAIVDGLCTELEAALRQIYALQDEVNRLYQQENA